MHKMFPNIAEHHAIFSYDFPLSFSDDETSSMSVYKYTYKNTVDKRMPKTSPKCRPPSALFSSA